MAAAPGGWVTGERLLAADVIDGVGLTWWALGEAVGVRLFTCLALPATKAPAPTASRTNIAATITQPMRNAR
jgi:hypothetical protein